MKIRNKVKMLLVIVANVRGNKKLKFWIEKMIVNRKILSDTV
jgi:hypothetical protein